MCRAQNYNTLPYHSLHAECRELDRLCRLPEGSFLSCPPDPGMKAQFFTATTGIRTAGKELFSLEKLQYNLKGVGRELGSRRDRCLWFGRPEWLVFRECWMTPYAILYL